MFFSRSPFILRRFAGTALVLCLLFSSAYVWGDVATPSAGAIAAPPSAAATDNLETVPGEPETTPPSEESDSASSVTTPSAPPAPAPAPSGPVNSDGYPLVESFAANLPSDFTLNLQYKKYLTNYDYALPKSGAGIRTGPGGSFDLIRKPGTYEKMSLVDSVKGEYIAKYNSDIWYRVYWYDKTGLRTGYVYGPVVNVRHFELARKFSEAKALQADLALAGNIAYVNNYKNKRGIPPKLPGGANDVFGNDYSQSAPGYSSLKNMNDFVYVQDGTLLLIIGQQSGYYQCRLPGKQTTYWIPQKYITRTSSMNKANKFVVVDRKQQNAAVFEQTASGWQLISYQVVTTGARDKYRYPTPLGSFMAIEKKTKFDYLHDETKEIDGYAPYVIRFSGGAYLHGVPVTYKKDPLTGATITPPPAEYLSTLGTIPRSHKCVRNYTSHAKFLYDWAQIGQTAVTVIE